jgi:hypothetical protein
MIREPTVLILGAGVSHDYGLPLGRELLLNIAKNLHDSAPNARSPLARLLKECGFTYSEIYAFRDELMESMQPSVDAFLEQRTEYSKIGKAAIAAMLIAAEDPQKLKTRESNIRVYEYLWHRMTGAPGSYPGNGLSVITFNYDRSFEYFLETALRASHSEFRQENEILRRATSHFPVIHVYGGLGRLEQESTNYLPYGTSRKPYPEASVITSAAERLRLYHETESDPQVVSQIRDLLAEASTVCFLGFAFHPVNVRLLKHRGLGERKETSYCASAFHLKEGERAYVENLLGFKIDLKPESLDALDTLRSLPVLNSVAG